MSPFGKVSEQDYCYDFNVGDYFEALLPMVSKQHTLLLNATHEQNIVPVSSSHTLCTLIEWHQAAVGGGWLLRSGQWSLWRSVTVEQARSYAVDFPIDPTPSTPLCSLFICNTLVPCKCLFVCSVVMWQLTLLHCTMSSLLHSALLVLGSYHTFHELLLGAVCVWCMCVISSGGMCQNSGAKIRTQHDGRKGGSTGTGISQLNVRR